MLYFYELTYISDSICQRICMLTSLRFDNTIILHVNSLQIDELDRIFFNDFSLSKQNFSINYEFFNIFCCEFSCTLHLCD